MIIALGGGSPMDAAKIMWVMYEHPETHFEELALRFMDIRKRIYKFPKMGVKAKMVAITTTSGTGSEVTPFAVVTDDATGQKYPLADSRADPGYGHCRCQPGDGYAEIAVCVRWSGCGDSRPGSLRFRTGF